MDYYSFFSLPLEDQLTVLRRTPFDKLTNLCKTSEYRDICTGKYDYLWAILVMDVFGVVPNVGIRTTSGDVPIYKYRNIQDYNRMNNTYFSNWFQVYTYVKDIPVNDLISMNDQLIHESAKGHLDVVKYLVELRRKIVGVRRKKDFYIDEALVNACQGGHLNVVKYLVNMGADIHVYTELPLILVSRYGYLDILIYLIDQGANVHADEDDALITASSNGHLDIVQYLITHGAQVDADNNRALIYASENGHLDVVEYLVSHGADIHDSDDKAFRVAEREGHDDILEYLNYINMVK